MKDLEEVNCEIRSVIDIHHCLKNHINNVEGDNAGSSTVSQIYNSLDGVYGGFLNDAAYAWLSYDCHLIVVNVKTGDSISSWTFRGKITCVSQFPARCGELPLVLVGLDNGATRIKDSVGLLCIFDCTSSRVLRAIRLPAGVEQVCIVSGGAEWEEFNDKRPDNILMQMDGIACVVLRNLHHLMIDLQRSTWEVSDLSVVMDETSPAEIEFLTTKDSFHSNGGKHMACNLLNQRIERHIGFNREEFESNGFLDEKLTNSIISSTRIGCLISGCLGRVIIWQNDGSVGWISQPADEAMIITHIALVEPTDDPRPFYYLWVVLQDDSFKVPPVLRMYALLFERKYCDKGTNLYFNLESEPCLKFEFELDPKDRVVSLSSIERGVNTDQTESELKRGEDSLLLISTTNRALLFDLNQWYKEQMPQTIGECKNPNSILASYNTKHQPSGETRNEIVSSTYIPRSLQEFPNGSLSSSEELFYPNSLSLEWIELSLSKLTCRLFRGVQADLLREMALAGPIILTQPAEMFHKCLTVGLTPFNTEVTFSSDHNVQRDMLLSLCLEQRWSNFLIRCANEWSDGSAGYMYPSFLKWGIQRASSIKIMADRLCVPLFDQSGNNIGEAEVKTLRFCYQQLECLYNVVAKLPFETSSLMKQRKALKRVSMYFQVLLWFYDVGLLPETQNMEEGSLPISLAFKIPYPFEKLFALYKEKRESVKDDKPRDENEEVLFIDELITRECPALNLQWEREATDTSTNGYYPPPSLQSLLRCYLTDCDQTESNEIECKHQITIYLLMDLAMLLQGSYPGVDQLIKYPSSFKMTPSLIKLTQAFWLLDHEDYHGFLDIMTGQLVSNSDVKNWHHKFVLRTLIRNSQHKLALMYLRIKKPPLSSVHEHSTLIDLLVEHGLVQSAFHRRPQSHYAQLLLTFFQACKNYNKLGEILHLALDPEEEETFVKFLEDSKSEDIKLLYYLQRCRYMEANYGNYGNSGAWSNAPGSKKIHVDMLNAYNATLPDVVKKFSVNMGKSNLDGGMEARYPRPMTHHKNSRRTGNIYETVIKKARETFTTEEKSVVPFITAPCTSLKSNDEKIHISCVMSPKVLPKNRKRTMDQVIHEEEGTGMLTPDRAKRRKTLEDGEAVLSAALSTPLVKRKICSNKDPATETPHSILKIRQLIRSSTSPTTGSLQEEVTDSPMLDKERKISRQIRFNISQTRKSASRDNVNGEDEQSKANASEEGEDVFFSPSVTERSITESAILSDSSYTCKNIYTARPRPSLRRTYLQTSTESVNESLATSRTRDPEHSRLSGSLVNAVDNGPRIAAKTTPQISRRCSSMFSASIRSPAILSPDSSFETHPNLRRSDDSDSRLSQQVHGRQDARYNCITSSTPLVKTSVPERSRYEPKISMDIEEDIEESTEEDIEEDIVPEAMHVDRHEESMESNMSNHFQIHDNEKRQDLESSNRKNGDLIISRTAEDSDEEHAEMDDEFKSFSNSTDTNLSRAENNERSYWSLRGKAQDKPEQEQTDAKNGEVFDITDDESSHSEDEVFLAFDETNSERKSESKIPSSQADNIFDALNMTDDESNSTVEIEEEKRSSFETSTKRESVQIRARVSTRRKEVSEESQSNNNHSKYTRTRKNLISKSPEQKEAVDTLTLDFESPKVGESLTPRMTRSRRASSVAKEIGTPPATPPLKVPAKTSRSKRGGSLVKEVLIASVAYADDEMKRATPSGSEESTGSSSPRRTRGKRASSVAKDVSMEAEVEEPRTPVRRSSRRSVSVQKELPEPVKPLTKSSRVSSTSSLIADDKEEVVPVETKNSKAKQSTGRGKKSTVAANKSAKDSRAGELEPEEANNVKRTRRRGTSVPKEIPSVSRSLRSSSVTKEIISEELEPAGQYLMEQAVRSPATSTRSRRSSIQSIPEELEEILSVPSKERVSSSTSKRKQTLQNPRQRRATSAELSLTDIKRRTRTTRGKGILEETIMEEDPAETENPAEKSNSKKVPTRRILLRTTSAASLQEVKETTAKGRRNRKPSKQAADQFSFSQPEKAHDPPLDQKAIGEVPKYMFSPPHTRSKTVAPDHRRGIKSFIPILSEDEREQEEEEVDERKGRNILQRSTGIKRAPYIRLTRCRTKFVLPKRANSTTD